MKTWITKEDTNLRPHDLLCCELEDGRKLWIHEDGGFDVELADVSSAPNLMFFDLFE